MRYIFFGTPEFAAIILEKLIAAGMPPTLVICNPDRPVGRKKIITPPPSKIIAQKYGVPVWQPESLEIKNLKLEIEKLGGVDFAIVVAYNKILRPEVLNALPAKFLGVHPSLLPKYRGATPIQNVILNGEKETGTTLFLLDEKVDHGAILATRRLVTSDKETYNSLLEKLAELSGDLLVETLPKFLKGEIKPQPQNEKEATYTKKFQTEDGYVDLEKDPPEMIERKTRALNPEPGVWTIINGRRTKILESMLVNGKLKIRKIQAEGKKPTVLD